MVVGNSIPLHVQKPIVANHRLLNTASACFDRYQASLHWGYNQMARTIPGDAAASKDKSQRRGPKKGSENTITKHTAGEWFAACKLFTNKYSGILAQKHFLESGFSGNKFTGTRSECQGFSDRLKLYREGKLSGEGSQRLRLKHGHGRDKRVKKTVKNGVSLGRTKKKRTKATRLLQRLTLARIAPAPSAEAAAPAPAANSGGAITNSKLAEIENRLVDYIDRNEEKFPEDTLGESWQFLSAKALDISKALGVPDGSFVASTGWLSSVLERRRKARMKSNNASNAIYIECHYEF